MPINAPDYSYLGSGEVHLRKKGAAAGFRSIGNASAYSLSPQSNSIDLSDSTSPGGNLRNSVQRITSVQFSLTMTDFSVENFADLLRGSREVIPAGTVPGEEAVAYQGCIIPLAYIATAITSVTSSDGGTTYEAGIDYDLKIGQLYIHETGSISDGSPIKVTYTYGAAQKLQALVNAAEEYELLFVGYNEARSGKKVRSQCWRVPAPVIGELAMIGDAHGSGTVTGNLLRDTTQPYGKSQYFTWEQED